MSQINLHTTPAFERALARVMRIRRIATKSDAIREFEARLRTEQPLLFA